jgi:hypothetical protein
MIVAQHPVAIAVNTRLGNKEDVPRRDLMKVAQYEVLGNDPKRDVRPARDDRKVPLLLANIALGSGLRIPRS